MRRVAHLVAGAVVLVACSGDDAGDAPAATTDEFVVDATESGASSTTQPTAASETTVDSTAAPAAAPATTTTPAATTPPSAPPSEPEPLLPGFDDLIELTVESGATPDRPVLSWTAVDGADHYGVYVYAPSGEIYWAWQGRDTSVPLGGAIGDAPGPLAADGMTWAVIGYDTELLPIAVSVVGPLAD